MEELDPVDIKLLKMATQLREAREKPISSLFRVHCILKLSDDTPPFRGITTLDDGTMIVMGCNTETTFMGGSLCAERGAICQLALFPQRPTISCVYIVSDASVCITPGALCREVLIEYTQNPGLRIVLSNSSLTTVETTNLGLLYPYPSLFMGVPVNELVEFGSDLAETAHEIVDPEFKKLVEKALEYIKASNIHGRSLHPIDFVAAVQYTDGTTDFSVIAKALEFGCSIYPMDRLTHCMETSYKTRGVLPAKIIQADQFGNLHSLFPPARSYFSEHSIFGETLLLLRDGSENVIIRASELLPSIPQFDGGGCFGCK